MALCIAKSVCKRLSSIKAFMVETTCTMVFMQKVVSSKRNSKKEVPPPPPNFFFCTPGD